MITNSSENTNAYISEKGKKVYDKYTRILSKKGEFNSGLGESDKPSVDFQKEDSTLAPVKAAEVNIESVSTVLDDGNAKFVNLPGSKELKSLSEKHEKIATGEISTDAEKGKLKTVPISLKSEKEQVKQGVENATVTTAAVATATTSIGDVLNEPKHDEAVTPEKKNTLEKAPPENKVEVTVKEDDTKPSQKPGLAKAIAPVTSRLVNSVAGNVTTEDKSEVVKKVVGLGKFAGSTNEDDVTSTEDTSEKLKSQKTLVPENTPGTAISNDTTGEIKDSETPKAVSEKVTKEIEKKDVNDEKTRVLNNPFSEKDHSKSIPSIPTSQKEPKPLQASDSSSGKEGDRVDFSVISQSLGQQEEQKKTVPLKSKISVDPVLKPLSEPEAKVPSVTLPELDDSLESISVKEEKVKSPPVLESVNLDIKRPAPTTPLVADSSLEAPRVDLPEIDESQLSTDNRQDSDKKDLNPEAVKQQPIVSNPKLATEKEGDKVVLNTSNNASDTEPKESDSDNENDTKKLNVGTSLKKTQLVQYNQLSSKNTVIKPVPTEPKSVDSSAMVATTSHVVPIPTTASETAVNVPKKNNTNGLQKSIIVLLLVIIAISLGLIFFKDKIFGSEQIQTTLPTTSNGADVSTLDTNTSESNTPTVPDNSNTDIDDELEVLDLE